MIYLVININQKKGGIKMEKVEIKWGRDGANINYAIETPTGVEVWEQQVSSHAYKNRDYQPRLVETISVDEFNKRQKKSAKIAAENKAASAAKKARAEKSFICPCCDFESDFIGSEIFEGERLCYDCLSGMFE